MQGVAHFTIIGGLSKSRRLGFWWCPSLNTDMPSPSRRTRDGEASTKPSALAAVVEAVHGERSQCTARSLGGQWFVRSGTKLNHYRVFATEVLMRENGGDNCA